MLTSYPLNGFLFAQFFNIYPIISSSNYKMCFSLYAEFYIFSSGGGKDMRYMDHTPGGCSPRNSKTLQAVAKRLKFADCLMYHSPSTEFRGRQHRSGDYPFLFPHIMRTKKCLLLPISNILLISK